MRDTTLDVRGIPPAERHPRIHDVFADFERRESLTLINDHEPRPLFFQMRPEVDEFDADRYTLDHRDPEEYVATFPEK